MDTLRDSKSKLETFLANPKKSLWDLALPIMFGLGIHTLYNIVDMLFIGRLGGEAITGIAFNMPIFFLMLGLTMGIGTGVTAAIARHIGEESKADADNSAEHAIVIALFISVTFTLLGSIFGDEILFMLGAKDNVLALASDYLSTIVVGLPFMVFGAFFRSILAGEGDMKFPMAVAGFGTILNIILDPIFIFELNDFGSIGLGLGIKGAALATVLSQSVVFIIFVYI